MALKLFQCVFKVSCRFFRITVLKKPPDCCTMAMGINGGYSLLRSIPLAKTSLNCKGGFSFLQEFCNADSNEAVGI